MVFEVTSQQRACARDVINRIGGQEAKGLTTLEAQNKLRGPKGNDHGST